MVIPVDVISPALIDSGLDVLADGGGSEFSLRRVGERIGFAGSAASHRFGNREGLLAAVGHAALEREAVEFKRFAADLPPVPCETEPLAAVLREWLDHRARWSRRQARTICELVLMGYRDGATSDFNKLYAELSCGFLTQICPLLSRGAAQVITLYLIAEAPNWLVMADETAFKLLSAETAGRVVAFALRQKPPTSHFWLDYSRSRPEPSLAALRQPAPTGAKQRILEAVMHMIEEEGAQAVTHRAISAKAKVSPSSLMHHFGKRSDLLRSGIKELFRHKLDAQNAGASLGAAATPYELALYALQDPFVAPLVAAVRRKLDDDSPSLPTRSPKASVGDNELFNLMNCAIALLGGARATMTLFPELAGYEGLSLTELKQNGRGGAPALAG
jgi:AcrR family transcriptional regulator